MSEMYEKELQTENEWRQAFPIMNELYPDLDEERFIDLVQKMTGEGYRLYALYHQQEMVGVAGVIILTSLCYGKHLWVYDLVTSSSHRSHGYGEELLTRIEDVAQRNHCQVISLTSGLWRTDAHRFYLKLNYEKNGFELYKKLQ
jgi:GNAT superfamily N-acetyltransferase